jgi:hypothetical protein
MVLQIIPVYIYIYIFANIYVYNITKLSNYINVCGKMVLLNGHHCHHENTSMGATRSILKLYEIVQAKWLPFA